MRNISYILHTQINADANILIINVSQLLTSTLDFMFITFGYLAIDFRLLHTCNWFNFISNKSYNETISFHLSYFHDRVFEM